MMAWNVTRRTESRYKVTELEDRVRHTTSCFRAPREYAAKFLHHHEGAGLEDPEEEPKLLHHHEGAGLEDPEEEPRIYRGDRISQNHEDPQGYGKTARQYHRAERTSLNEVAIAKIVPRK